MSNKRRKSPNNGGAGNAGTDESAGRLWGTLMILAMLSAALLYWTSQVAEVVSEAKSANNDVTKLTSTIRQAGDGKAAERCAQICTKRRDAREQHFGGNFLRPKSALEMAQKAHRGMISNLKVDYGPENYKKMFEDVVNESKKYGFFKPTEGTDTMKISKDKLKIKILTTQTKLIEKERNLEGCDCINGDKPLDETLTSMDVTDDFLKIDAADLASFVWMTGGHSSAAGHGNMFNESYTAFAEKTAKGVFASVGINFEAKNYAMGGTSSAPEIALCNQAVFGFDFDALSWDYGMTDGRKYEKVSMFFYRAAMLPNQPMFAIVELGGRPPRGQMLQEVAKMGHAAFIPDDAALGAMRDGIPDTLGMTEEQLQAMPPMVRNFKCNNQLEKGEPHCGSEKYTNYMCNSRKGKASWHPGFKYHALYGNRIAMMMSQLLIDALAELVVDLEATDAATLLRKLQDEQRARYEHFKTLPIPNMAGWASGRIEGMDTELLLRSNGICKTARTPSKTRYEGILTNTDKVGGFSPPGKETYEVGITMIKAQSSPANGEMRLTISDGRERCDAIVKPDYKDFFYAEAGNDEWMTLSLPNEKEKEAFNYDPDIIKGTVVVCTGACPWGKCRPQDIAYTNIEKFEAKAFEMKVNEVPVTKIVPFDGECVFLHHAGGPYFPKNANKGFDVSVKINEAKHYMRIQTLAVF
mmetsp:Transcript_28736/g.81038  ORF Transcript_28736/g.81038 Transcript_28736/m.81038 type:complete len:695 (+) Transcript_28736:156-2240(+)